MQRRHLILLAAACIFVLGGTIWFLSREREPSYSGRSLSEWLARCNTEYWVESEEITPEARRQEAYTAIKAMGTNAVPWLTRWLCYEPPVWKRKLRALATRLGVGTKSSMQVSIPQRSRDAVFGFEALGEACLPAVPQILRAIENPNTDYEQIARAGSTLARIGPGALPAMLQFATDQSRTNRDRVIQALLFMRIPPDRDAPLVPVLVHCLSDTNEDVAATAAAVLGVLKAEPNVTVPALANGLQDTRFRVKVNSANGLARFGRQASSAVPALIEALADPALQVRVCATNALLNIAPEALARVGNGGGW